MDSIINSKDLLFSAIAEKRMAKYIYIYIYTKNNWQFRWKHCEGKNRKETQYFEESRLKSGGYLRILRKTTRPRDDTENLSFLYRG